VNNDEADEEFDAIVGGQEMSRMARLLAGELSVEDLDDEELYRGQCRDRRGGFSGGTRDMVPRAMIVEWQRRVRTGALNRLDGNLLVMTDALVSIITNPDTGTADRLAAIKYGMDRVLGKAPDRVELAVSQKPWEGLIAPGGIFRQIADEPPAPVPAEIEAGAEE
jgi:hypothetical protein